MSERPNVTLPGTVERIIKPPNEPEKAQTTVKGADHLCREIRIDNTLRNENGGDVSLQAGARVDVTLEAESEATTLKSNGNGKHSTSAPMNRPTLFHPCPDQAIRTPTGTRDSPSRVRSLRTTGTDGQPLRGVLAPCRSRDTGKDLLSRRLRRPDPFASCRCPRFRN